MSQICLRVPSCIPMLTVCCCHTIVIPFVIPLSYPGRRFGVCVGFANSVWLSWAQICPGECAKHDHKTFEMSSSEHLTSSPHVVTPCCHTRFYGPRAAHPDWHEARPRANLERATCVAGLYGTRPRCYTLVVIALRHTSCFGHVVIFWCMDNDSFVTALFIVKSSVFVWPWC